MNPRSAPHPSCERAAATPTLRSVAVTLLIALAILATTFITGCNNDFSPADSGLSTPTTQPGGFGATPGGVQDMRFARELVANQMVPPHQALTVEGMFSEHDLPLAGDACATTLCLRGALGWEGNAGWIQVGLSSTVDPATYERPSLGLVLLVDVSGSMGWDYGEYGEPARVARALLLALVEQLGAADRVGIATFASESRLLLDFVAGDQHGALTETIGALRNGGSTYMEAGVQLARDMFAETHLETADRRLLILTDAQANVGATEPGSFMELAGELEQMGIGITMIGTGIGLNPDIMQAMIDLRGGNGYSLATHGLVSGFMDDSWPWMVCPIAHDLTVDVSPAGGFSAERGYGFPGDTGELRAASVFLSRRRGALLLRLIGGTFEQLGAELDLAYTDPDGTPHTETLSLRLPGGVTPDKHGRYFEQYGARKSTALALLVADMREAAGLYATERDASLTLMRRATERFDSDADALLEQGQGDETEIERERRLAHGMLDLMENGAGQGTLYGPDWPVR